MLPTTTTNGNNLGDQAIPQVPILTPGQQYGQQGNFDVKGNFTPNSAISSANLNQAAPVSLPTVPPSTTAAGISGVAQANADIARATLDQQAKATAAQTDVASNKITLTDIMNKIVGVQTSRPDLETAAGLDTKKQAITTATNNLQASQRAQTNELRALDSQFMTPQAKQAATADINRKYAFEQADLALIQSAANNDYSTASSILDHKIQLQLEPLQTQLDFTKQFYQDNKDLFSKAEDRAFQTQTNQLAQQYASAKAGATEVGDAIKAVLATGQKLDPSILSQLNNAKNGADAYNILARNGINLQTQKFQALPFGATSVYNPLTGDVRSLGSPTGPTSPGATVADRNNNPGNLKGSDGQFQTFNSPQEGQQALVQDLAAKMTGATSTGLTSKSTLQDLADVWAPSSDNNDPKKYAQNLASQLGVTTATPIGTLLPRVSEVAAAIAKNEGGTYVDPQAPLRIATQFGVNLTADQAANFLKVPQAEQGTVAGILSGKRLISGLTTRSGYNQTILNYVQSVDPTFDSVSTEAGQKFRLSTDTQKFVANANTASNTLDQIITLSNQVDRGGITVLNNGILKLKQGVSDPNAVKLATLSGILADELGKILGSSQGTDFTIQLGQSLVNPALGKQAFAAQANLLKDRIANKLSEYQAQGNQSGSAPALNTQFDNLFKQYGGQ